MRSAQARHRHVRTPSRGYLRWVRSRRLWTTLGWLAALVVVACGLNRLEPYVRRINTAPTVIEWMGTPDWLGYASFEDVLPTLEEAVTLAPDTDPYDERVCPYVAERVAASPWVEGVRSVSKQADGRVKVHAAFRKPFAWVKRGLVAYLVDEHGVRLPKELATADVNRADWWLIQGVAKPAPKPGERWAGGDVAEGLKLARFLYRAETAGRMPLRESIRAIDVSNFRGRADPRAGRLQLATINPGSYIHWGLPPGEEYGIESSAELKLAILNKLHAARGRLPDEGPIDVRSDDSIGFGTPDWPSD